jgi:hypothetical protein
MQQPEKAATEALPQCRAGFHFEGEAGIIEPQFADTLAQFLEIRRIDREISCESVGTPEQIEAIIAKLT